MFNKIIIDDINFIIKELKHKTNINKLSNTNILITGGTGLFGKSILNSLICLRNEISFNIYILTRNKHTFLNKYKEYNLNYIHFIEADIRSFTIKDINFDYIIHAATPASEQLEKENPDEMYSIILDGTKHIINITKNMDIRKLLFTSSGAVYGEQYEYINSFDEDYDGNPITYYGKAKKISEQLFLETDLNISIARCFAFVGPYLNLNIHFAIGNFIRDVINNEDIIIKGNGTPLRTYMYTADLVLWLLTIMLESDNKKIYNVGASEAISILELAQKVSHSIPSYNGNIRILTNFNESDKINKYIPNNTRIKEELNLKENFTLDEAINRTFLFEEKRREEKRREEKRREEKRRELLISLISLIYIIINYNQCYIKIISTGFLFKNLIRNNIFNNKVQKPILNIRRQI